MRIQLHHKLFEKLPTCDKPLSIIFLVSLRTYWKVKWLCEYSVISHWKFLTDGPNTQLWSFSAACLLTHFSVYSSTLNLLQGRYVATANTASSDTFSLVLGHRQPLVTVSFSDMIDKSGKQNLWEKIWNQVPALTHYVKMISCFLSIVWWISHDPETERAYQEKTDFSDRNRGLVSGESSWSALKDEYKFHFPNSHWTSKLEKHHSPSTVAA